MKQLQAIAFMLLLLAASYSYSQTGVIVTYYDGTTQNFNVATTGKLYFSNDDLNVKRDVTASVTTIPVSIIKKIVFSNTLGTSTIGENRNNLSLYPNPSSDTIQIKSDSTEELDLKIYALTGQLIQQGIYQSSQSIDVSSLAKGLYLVQVNGLTVKFSKK